MSAKTNNLCLFKYDPSTDGAQTFNIKQALNDNWDKLDANVLLALAAAAPYSETQTYALGVYCIKDAKLYRCTTAITTAEAWTAAHWTETTLGAELVAVYAALAAKAPSTHASQHASGGSDPVTPASIGAVSKSGDTMTGNLKVPNLDVAKDKCAGYIYGETNSLCFRGGNPSTGRYGYANLKESGFVVGNPDVTVTATRNIYGATTAITAGTSNISTGVIYLQYE